MLKNTYAKLASKKPLTIAYFGGSITEGTGFGDPADCWRTHITAWFRENYPESEIREINAAIGGTGSDLGIFRCDSQVTSYEPDLVFLEFAVNDHHLSTSLICLENIIRKLLYANARTDLVLVMTATQSIHNDLKNGAPVYGIAAYRTLAEHYGLDLIDLGAEFMNRVDNGEGTWDDYTKDTVHPNKSGYVLYTNCVARYLAQSLRLPSLLTTEQFLPARMVDAADHAEGDFTVKEESMRGRWPRMIELSEKGQKATLRFTGTTVGIYMLMAKDSGDFLWSIDGGTPTRESTWDTYALRFNRANYHIFTTDLPLGEHTLTLEALGEKAPESTGTFVRIGAFLIS